MNPALRRIGTRRRIITLVVLVLYEPIVYWGLYRAVVLPRLAQWREIPTWMICAAIAPYAIGVFSLGPIASGLERLAYCACLALAHWSLAHLMYSLDQPGYMKAEGFNVPILFLAIAILYCTMTAGHFVHRALIRGRPLTAKRIDGS